MRDIQYKLINMVDELIKSEGSYTSDGYQLNFLDLDTQSKQSLVELLIERCGNEMTCLSENIRYNQIVHALKAMLKNNTNLSQKIFTTTVSDSICEYYEITAQTVIDDRCAEMDREEAWSTGKSAATYVSDYHNPTI